MRTLRLSLVVAVIGFVLSGLGGAAIAQADDDAPSSKISARLLIDAIVDPGTMEYGDETVHYRGLTETRYVYDPSDSRFSGRLIWTGNRVQHNSDPSFYVWHGSYRIENEDGAWQERPTVWLDGMAEYMAPVTSVFTGEGAYEGWTVVGELSEDENMRIDGFIFKGDIPPAPDPAPLSTE